MTHQDLHSTGSVICLLDQQQQEQEQQQEQQRQQREQREGQSTSTTVAAIAENRRSSQQSETPQKRPPYHSRSTHHAIAPQSDKRIATIHSTTDATMTLHAPTKENNGKAYRRQQSRFWAVCLGVTLLCAVLAVSLLRPLLHAHHSSSPPHASSPGLRKHRLSQAEVIAAVAEGHLQLVDLYTTGHIDAAYSNIKGDFCPVLWEAHKEQPYKTPMFRDVLAASSDCAPSLRYTVDLAAVLAAVKEYDNKPDSDVHTMELKGAVFHESRCGSTLIANLLQAWSPHEHVVYSESGPPVAALRICGDDTSLCADPRSTAVKVLKETVYLMSRTRNEHEQSVFFKIQSIGTRQLSVWTEAYPETPWFFLFREPTEVLASQLKQGPHYANCVRPQRSASANAVASIKDLMNRYEVDNVQDLSPTEYCALHLATLTHTAVRMLSDVSIPLLYSETDFVDKFKVFAQDRLGLKLDTLANSRLTWTAQQYSKGRNQARVFEGDSQAKQERATDEMRKAGDRFLKDSYRTLFDMSERAWRQVEKKQLESEKQE
jgi:hypothetical protein